MEGGGWGRRWPDSQSWKLRKIRVKLCSVRDRANHCPPKFTEPWMPTQDQESQHPILGGEEVHKTLHQPRCYGQLLAWRKESQFSLRMRLLESWPYFRRWLLTEEYLGSSDLTGLFCKEEEVGSREVGVDLGIVRGAMGVNVLKIHCMKSSKNKNILNERNI